MAFEAIRLLKTDDGVRPEFVTLEDRDLVPGEVTIEVEYSTVNYKDGLAITNRAPIVRRFPLIPGIDLAGRVVSSESSAFAPGDRVVVNGQGLGESHDGGVAQKARVPGSWPVKLPASLTTRHAAAIGTAGFTAMLSILALERQDVTPRQGEVLVTGACGGVGSVAIALLSSLGYRVVASTGRLEERDYLESLGASDVIDRRQLSEPGKPLGVARWAGAVDSVGSHTLANVLAQTRYGGVVASAGLAQGADLPATVYPFILRAVTLAGINSVETPRGLRETAWKRLAQDLDRKKLEAMTTSIDLRAVPEIAQAILDGKIRGRTVVDLQL